MKTVHAAASSEHKLNAPHRNKHWNKISQRIGILSTAYLTSGLLLHGSPSWAISTENLLFLEAWRGVDRAYVDKKFNNQNWLKLRDQYLKKEPMNNRRETYASIEKMLMTLGDPFTRFLEPPKFDALKGGTKGVITGVGMEVAYSSNPNTKPELTVIAPAPNSPALRAGIQTGDVLLEINGMSTNNESLFVVGEMLQGDPGSQIQLTLKRKSTGKIETVGLTREKVVFNPVSYKYCNGIAGVKEDGQKGNIGYIQIARFTDQTAVDVLAAIKTLQKQGVDQFVLDLRNNGGGSFPAGVSVSRMWLDSGDIVMIADTQGVRDIVSSESSAVDVKTPLIVLINGGTASASEVLSGALQDNNRGLIVGEPSFGKGLIQTLIPLSDGSGITVTTAKYQTPSGKDINGTGIEPDVKLSIPLVNKDQICETLKTSSFSFIFNEQLPDRT